MFKHPESHVHVSNLCIGNSNITRVGSTCTEKSVRFLGIWIDEHLSFSGHIEKLKSKLNSGLYALSTCNKFVPLPIRKNIYSSLFESHLRFGSLIVGAAAPKLLEPISIIQRKALRLVARAPYNAHTDELFKMYNFLKYDDIVTLNQCIFMRQYSNKQLPMSFKDMFKYLPLSQQVFRDHDYNFIPKEVTNPHLKFYPIVQMLRAWNASNIFVKSKAEIIYLKKTFITQCLSGYEEECVKPKCYVCSRT